MLPESLPLQYHLGSFVPSAFFNLWANLLKSAGEISLNLRENFSNPPSHLHPQTPHLKKLLKKSHEIDFFLKYNIIFTVRKHPFLLKDHPSPLRIR